MKVAFVTPNFLPQTGGTEIAIHNIAKILRQKGIDISIIKLVLNGQARISEIDGIKVYEFMTARNWLSYFHTNASLYKFLRKHIKDVDIIHQFHLLRMGLPTVIFGRTHHKPVVTSLMGTDTYNPLRKIPRLIHPYLSFIMNSSDSLTSPSETLAQYAYKQGYKGGIKVIPHGIDINRYEHITTDQCNLYRTKLSIAPETKVLFSVQRLHQIKRIDITILAIKELLDTYRTRNLKLLIAGDGPERNKLETLVERLNLNDHIVFLGSLPYDILSIYYKMADICVLHSTFEAFGLVLAEAMAAGKPVISTRVGAIPEVVEHNETGLLIPPENPKELAKAIKKMLDNPRLVESFGAKGREKAISLYGWDNICDQYIEIYDRIMKRDMSFQLVTQ